MAELITKEPERGNIPVPFLLGFIAKESSGNPETHHLHEKRDEVGLFQISKEERGYIHMNASATKKDLSDHDKLLSPQFLGLGVKAGIKLMNFYEQRFTDKYPTLGAAPALHDLARLAHQQGVGTVNLVLRKLTKEGVDLSKLTLPQLVGWSETHQVQYFSPARVERVVLMHSIGEHLFKLVEQQAKSATP
ncbi:MAG: transglycosylase SLT domain-containing protein [Acidobacteria bacterium]|nr:transglycosylase SLT domain-containing protein [Acidobacteriota bacterium]